MTPLKVEEILSAWNDIPAASEPDQFRAVRIQDMIYLAKSHGNTPALIVTFPQHTSLPGGRRTRGLSLTYYQTFRLLQDGKSHTDTPAAVLVCLDPPLTYLFAVLCKGLCSLEFNSLPHARHPYEVLDYIEAWQELLRKRRLLTREEQIGLWGELYFIISAPLPERAMQVWYGPLRKRFDFSANNVDVDIKTSLRPHEHYFAAEQLGESPATSDRYIVSFHLEEDPAAGRSLNEQVAQVRNIIGDLNSLERKLCALGYSDEDHYPDRFTLRASAFVRASDVPRVRALDAGVSHVTFRSSLVRCPKLTEHEVASVVASLLYRSD